MNKTKKVVSLLLAAAVLIGVICTAPFDVFAAATTHYVNNAAELQTARNAINATGGEHIISLKDDISGNDVSVDISKSGAVVTIIGNGHSITSTGNTVYVSNGATVNLGDGNSELTLKSTNNNDTSGVIYVLNNATCNMYDKVTVKDHKGNNYVGGGVTVLSATFHMYGGTIDNCGIDGGSVCYGGGVAVINGGKFIMDGGTISNCYVKSDYIDDVVPDVCFTAMGGGVFVTGGSSFTMNGGTISNCSATNFGGGVAMVLGDNEVKLDPNTGDPIIDPDTHKGIVDQGNPRSKVTINGGSICNNKAKNGAGVFASGYYYSFYKVALTGDSSIGAPSNPGLYINGGANKNVEISSNTATDMGGGVLITGLKDTPKAQLHNAKIINNTASTGAGVMNHKYWTKLDIDGCTITGNEATSNGGGIMASGNSDGGYTLVKDTVITDNTSGDRGAGVYYDSVSKICLSGADIIQDNTYDGKLNNLNVLSLKKPVEVVGDLTGSEIGLSDPTLWDDNKEDTAADAVSTKCLTNGFKANNDSLIPADAFTSDHESWYVDYGEKYISPKTVYKYTAQKYNNNLGMDEGYSIKINPDNNAEYIKFDATSFSNENPKQSTVFMNEFNQRFLNEGYTFVTDYYYLGYSSYPGKIYQDPKSGVYIALLKVGQWTVYIYTSNDIDYLQNNVGGFSALQGAGNIQDYDGAENGKVVLVSQGYNDDDSLFTGASASEEELEYDEPLNFGNAQTKTIYKINDYGFATTKYVINKSSEEEEGSYDYTSEVRLVRRTTPIKFHVNEPGTADKLFRVYNADDSEVYGFIEDGKYDLNSHYQISEFYNIPAFAGDDYVFAGWYYDSDGDKDGDIPFEFDASLPANLTDVYAHWISVGEVSKDGDDDKVLPSSMNDKYSGFELFGVQIRPEAQFDQNLGEYYYGGLRFVSSVSENLLSNIDALSGETVNGNKVEYGFVTAAKSTIDTVANEPTFNIDTDKYKIQYKGTNVNGVDTTVRERSANNFRYVTNVDCTSQIGGYGSNPKVKIDHKNFSDYRLMTFVVNYTGETAEADKGEDIVARAYLRYYDANGLLRTFYNDYGGTNVYGGCSTSFNTVNALISGDIKTDVKQ